MVSTHWVGYVHNIFKLYTAPYKQTKKDRLLKKAPLEVRHNEGGSFFFFECKWVPMSAPHSGSNYWSNRLQAAKRQEQAAPVWQRQDAVTGALPKRRNSWLSCRRAAGPVVPRFHRFMQTSNQTSAKGEAHQAAKVALDPTRSSCPAVPDKGAGGGRNARSSASSSWTEEWSAQT